MEKPEELKSMNMQELASLYNVSSQTMRKWIKKIPDPENILKKIGYIFTPKQIELIRSHLG
jgi:DeoR/GlpR family transcriptional regulator of sugar metabolism